MGAALNHFLSISHSGSHRIAAHTVLGILHGTGFCQQIHRALGSGVHTESWAAVRAGSRGNIDDGPVPLFYHIGQDQLRHGKVTSDI